MLPENIIYIGLVINLIGEVIYLISMAKGDTKPNLVSWFFWAIIPMFGVYFQLKAGAGLSVLPIFMMGFGPLLVFVYSLIKKNGYWSLGLIDFLCGFFALLSLVFYLFTHNLEISILFVILGDLSAGIPTIIKSWKFPETESYYIYVAGTINNIFGLLIIKKWSFSIYSLGIYFLLINLIITYSIVRKKLFKKVIFS